MFYEDCSYERQLFRRGFEILDGAFQIAFGFLRLTCKWIFNDVTTM